MIRQMREPAWVSKGGDIDVNLARLALNSVF